MLKNITHALLMFVFVLSALIVALTVPYAIWQLSGTITVSLMQQAYAAIGLFIILMSL